MAASTTTQRNPINQRRNSTRPSVGYLLFQYQTELTRRNAEPTRLSRTKYHITDGLVAHTFRHLRHCTTEDLIACKRELVYKEKLRDQIKTMKRKKVTPKPSATITASTTTASMMATGKAKPVVTKAPATPPKPLARSKVSIFGPEIFV